MLRKVIVAGLLGGIVLFAWTFAVNGILGFRKQRRPEADPERTPGLRMLEGEHPRTGQVHLQS
jgi:hypothetical protein